MKKTIYYNNTEVLRIEDEQSQYDPVVDGEFVLVQSLYLAEIMLSARGIGVVLIKNFVEP